MDIKTQKFENNFCIKNSLNTRELLITGLLTAKKCLQRDEYKGLDFLKEDITKARERILEHSILALLSSALK